MDASTWVAEYERAWRDRDTASLERLFTANARYLRSAYDEGLTGLDEIRGFWADDTPFTMTSQIVATEGDTAVVRVEVHYCGVEPHEYRDLWIPAVRAGRMRAALRGVGALAGHARLDLARVLTRPGVRESASGVRSRGRAPPGARGGGRAMSTDTPPLPDDETRAHATEPAEGSAAASPAEATDLRLHASEPAEGKDDAGT